MKKILLLGSGELGKEVVIALQRLGQYIIAVDSYKNAPAMQVAHEFEVINMLDGKELDKIVDKHKPDFIVPEIESIRTERFYDYEKSGITVIPSAKAANFTMNRKAIRDLAAIDLEIQTAQYIYAKSYEQLKEGVHQIGMPCVVKPLMSSSGKGQSIIKKEEDIIHAWEIAISGSRGDLVEVIVEAYIDFDFEITLLTLTQNNGNTLFCPAIGHRQERGDYQESWQPINMNATDLKTAQEMAKKITKSLGGSGIWGVEFFISKSGVYFSELSPRPHDTGMVTLAGTQNFSEFELHARAILGLPVLDISLIRNGASAVILSSDESDKQPNISGLDLAANFVNTDFKLFGKPATKIYRRMGVALAYGNMDTKILVERAKEVASKIKIN
ncbi:MAG: formate-dependent phosphoribosylglycinamide formyltransferase [Flavobacteriales bacterium]|jgi:phosphoribosylglycinamide formyltransferase 2|nr:formate-dependent phosphoribosylglycinamide formyltransferase [Flavobacteriales bacterium]MDG2085851.1 formate-dependent phosphoribosylglycinamide formyltransferase [Flavobacteriales bacterium]